MALVAERNSFAHFSDHLVQYHRRAGITFKAPLCNDAGEIVVTKGSGFDEDVKSKARELDYLDCIALNQPLTSQEIFEDFHQLIRGDSALGEFHERYGDLEAIKKSLSRLADQEAIMLQLGVLKMQLPMVYQQALFCAWLGVALMQSMKRSSADVYTAFFLAMVHDVGLLHVPMEYVKSRKKFHYKQLCVLQSHTVEGYRVLKRVCSEPDELLRAVSEHHENLDGTGYPVGKVGNTISRFGQFLNFLDAINAIYTKRLKPGNRPIRDLIPMIQMNGHSRFGIYGKKLIEWLKALPEPKVRAVPNVLMPFLIQAVRDRHGYIASCVDIMARLSSDIGFRHGDTRVFALQNTVIHINISITQSGIINSAYMRWLDQVEAEGLVHAYREVEDVFLMMQEVIYHIGKLQNQIEYFLTTPCESEEAYKLKKGLERLERVHLPKIHPNLEILWIANVH